MNHTSYGGVCSKGPGHMTDMAATPIYEKKTELTLTFYGLYCFWCFCMVKCYNNESMENIVGDSLIGIYSHLNEDMKISEYKG